MEKADGIAPQLRTLLKTGVQCPAPTIGRFQSPVTLVSVAFFGRWAGVVFETGLLCATALAVLELTL